MTSRKLTAVLPCSAAEAIVRLRDETQFPLHADDIVSVTPTGDGTHRWVLAFRGGTAEWVQATADTEQHRIEFVQVSGDFQSYQGSWTAGDAEEGCEVTFEVRYRTNVPHLAGAIDSAVGRVISRVAHQILSGIGPARITAGERFLRDLPEHIRPERTQSYAVR